MKKQLQIGYIPRGSLLYILCTLMYDNLKWELYRTGHAGSGGWGFLKKFKEKLHRIFKGAVLEWYRYQDREVPGYGWL